MKKTQTANRGASIRSAVIKAKIRRMEKKYGCSPMAMLLLAEIDGWISQCDERASKRKGGLGRR